MLDVSLNRHTSQALYRQIAEQIKTQIGNGRLPYRLALQNGFAFTPGEAYLMDAPDAEHLRLCFGNQSTVGIRAGVQILSDLITQRVRAGSRPSTWLPIV